MNKHIKLVPVFTALMLFSSTQLYALDGSNDAGKRINNSSADFEYLSSASLQKMYLLSDTKILSSNSSVASDLETQNAGAEVSIIKVEGSMCQVLTATGKVGYVDISKLTSQKEYIFVTDNVTMYAASDGVVLKTLPTDSGENVLTIDMNTELQVTGSNSLTYWRVVYEGATYYIDHNDLSSTETVIPTASESTSSTAEASYTAALAEATLTWSGQSLTPFEGSIIGPSGKETYYNLNMSGVVSIMRNMGNTDEYWVRSDGVKMLGNYVIVAADLSIRPRGSLIETSLGMGIVCDTGSFIYSNPTQLDIAVSW